MGFLKKLFGSKDADDKSPFSEKNMKTLPPSLVKDPFGKINYWDLPEGGKRVRVYFLMENPIEGAQTGVALDGSLSMLGAFGKELKMARQATQPELQALAQAGIRISMDGRGRAHDNIFVERLWRSVKYEEVYPKAYDTLDQAYQGLEDYFKFYNDQRPHQALNNRTPAEVYADR